MRKVVPNNESVEILYKNYMSQHSSPRIGAYVRLRFDRYHGEGSFDRIVGLLQHTVLNYDDVGKRFDLSREHVRQLHDSIFPEAKGTGKERRTINSLLKFFKDLTRCETFVEFYSALSEHSLQDYVRPIISHNTFKKKTVMLGGKKVVLGKATPYSDTYQDNGAIRYVIRNPREDSEYIFFSLPKGEFLFMPRSALESETRTTYVDSARSKYNKFKNNIYGIGD